MTMGGQAWASRVGASLLLALHPSFSQLIGRTRRDAERILQRLVARAIASSLGAAGERVRGGEADRQAREAHSDTGPSNYSRLLPQGLRRVAMARRWTAPLFDTPLGVRRLHSAYSMLCQTFAMQLPSAYQIVVAGNWGPVPDSGSA